MVERTLVSFVHKFDKYLLTIFLGLFHGALLYSMVREQFLLWDRRAGWPHTGCTVQMGLIAHYSLVLTA